MTDFDSAEMLTDQICGFFDCTELKNRIIANKPVCSDCEFEIENGDRGICETCKELWIVGDSDSGCDCNPVDEEIDRFELSDGEEHRLNSLAAEKNGVRL